ncbi:U3 small nucleolar RNA-associated protein [Salix suchowensis]|nr:U3 small nucleolar RNA-associated protein [Salix suchowensis]
MPHLKRRLGPPIPRATQTSTQKDDEDSSDDEEEDWTDSWIVTGGSDSSLRKWDVFTGRVVDRLMVDKTRGERTLVWTVGALGDGTIISGDSLGNVKFWDSRTCTQIQSFPAHGADVLCLICGPAPVSYRRCTHPSFRWSGHDGSTDPAALSTNTIVKVINPLNTSSHATFDDAYHRKIAYTTGPSSTSGLCLAKATRLLACMRERSLSIWRIHPKASAVDEEDAEGVTPVEERGWDKVLDMELNVNTNLVACRISDDARWLVVSDLYETKLFSLKESVDGDIIPSRIRDFSSTLKAQLPEANATTGALAFAFTPDSSKLAMSVALSGYILIIDLHSHDEKSTVLRRFNQHRKSNGHIGNRVVRGRRAVDADPSSSSEAEEDEKDEEELEDQKPILARITRMTISADGQWLATSDDLSRTHIFNMDSIQHHCILPSSPLPVQTMSFDPKRPNILIMAFPNNTMQMYDVEARQSPIWAQDFCNSLPKRFTHAHDPVLGIAFDSIAPRRLTWLLTRLRPAATLRSPLGLDLDM